MGLIKTNRIESIDLLRGVVMVIMALDHVRSYFHFEALLNDPTDLQTTTPILFFTRFITHYCAPIFVFLAGTSAFLYGQRKSKIELFKFLFTRGLWLIFVEIFIMTFIWWFDPAYGFINLQVIWAIGLCMVILSGLIFIPKKVLLLIALILVFGHNALDGITMEGNSLPAILWYIIHQMNFIQLEGVSVNFLYPILPWVGVIALGYLFGSLYAKDVTPSFRKKTLLWLGAGCLGLFFVLRAINVYGDLVPWATQKDITYTILSFFNVTKYPPSLAFLLITLGPGFLFLYFTETIQNKLTNFFLVFGRVPFFYYVLHVLLIHLAAILGLLITGKDWQLMVLTNELFTDGKLVGYGYPLWVVYLIWILVVWLLYYPSKKYMEYKMKNRQKWWLSYL